MRIEVTIAKTSSLSAGAIDALAGELSRRIQYVFPDNEGHVPVCYAATNNLSAIDATREDKQRISEILQETWESAGDWFVNEQYVVISVFARSPRPLYLICES